MALFSRKSSTTVVDAPAAASTPDSQVLDNISGAYAIDPTHSRIGFSARHAMVTKVRGQFDEFEGSAHVDTVTPANSTVTVTIQAASVTTGNEQRDGHLKTPDFFDIANYPQITFVSTDVERDGTEWAITGDLTINGVTKPVTFDLEFDGVNVDPWNNTKAGFSAVTEISRKEWGIAWNVALETGGVLVGDKVKIELDIQAAKAA